LTLASSASFVCSLTQTKDRSHKIFKSAGENVSNIVVKCIWDFAAYTSVTRATKQTGTDLNTLGSCKQCFICLFFDSRESSHKI